MKILIVGSGPTGLTAAVELARQGIIPRLIEKKTDRSRLSRAVGILPNSLHLLSASGVSKKLLDKGIKVNRINFYTNDKPLAVISLEKTISTYPYLLTLAQDKTEQLLEESLSALGGAVDYSTELVGLNQIQDGVVVDFADGSEDTFDYVVAADGVNSKTRQSAGLDFPGFELNEIWSIADVDADNWRHPFEFTACLLGRGRAAVIVPLEKNRYRLISNTADVLSHLTVPLNISQIRRQGQFTIAIRQLRHYQRRRVFLAGDAAHCHSPFGGRGMNLGIADAAEFANRLLNNSLDHYSQSRHEAGLRAITESERFRKLVTTANPLIFGCFRAGLSLVNHSSALQKMFANRLLTD